MHTIEIKTIPLHHQSNIQSKITIMKIKLILICLFGTLLSMQAQPSVKPSLAESSGCIPGKVIYKKNRTERQRQGKVGTKSRERE